MRDFTEDLKFYKQERDRLKSEINELESRIIVEGGRNNRFEVNNYRNRVNRLQMKLNDVLVKIDDLEKQIDNNGQIQVISNGNGEITISDNLVLDGGFPVMGGDVVQTVDMAIERKIIYKGGEPVSCVETITKTTTTTKVSNDDDIYVKSAVID